jgi:hypothetical protein
MRTLTLLLGVLGAVLALGSVPPRTALRFDGLSSYAAIPDNAAFSVSPMGLTVSVWLRPDARRFSKTEGSLPTEQFVHWLGKGEVGRQEWTFRMYSRSTPPGPRDNRISFYVFNPAGGRGCGSYFQDPVDVGKWLHVVGVVDAGSHTTAIYKNGQLRNTNAYGGTIIPAHGIAPLRLGTKDFASFLRGALSQLRVACRCNVSYGAGQTVPASPRMSTVASQVILPMVFCVNSARVPKLRATSVVPLLVRVDLLTRTEPPLSANRPACPLRWLVIWLSTDRSIFPPTKVLSPWRLLSVATTVEPRNSGMLNMFKSESSNCTPSSPLCVAVIEPPRSRSILDLEFADTPWLRWLFWATMAPSKTSREDPDTTVKPVV